MFVDNAADARRFFLDVERKRRDPGEVLTPLEAMIADILARHPEYESLLSDAAAALAADFPADPFANPFLHLSLHVALAEQIGADRPPGIRALSERAATREQRHTVEHRMLEVLAQTLAASQQTGQPPDEVLYLDELKRRLT
mgnify:CR=1 FL=1